MTQHDVTSSSPSPGGTGPASDQLRRESSSVANEARGAARDASAELGIGGAEKDDAHRGERVDVLRELAAVVDRVGVRRADRGVLGGRGVGVREVVGEAGHLVPARAERPQP